MILPPYTPEAIASLRHAEPHDPPPNDVALDNMRALVSECERAGIVPIEIDVDAMGGVAAYWDSPRADAYLFNNGAILLLQRVGGKTRTMPSPAAVVAALMAARQSTIVISSPVLKESP